MKYRIDTDRIYCTGISIGGYGIYAVAMDFPDIFATIVSLCQGISINKIKFGNIIESNPKGGCFPNNLIT